MKRPTKVPSYRHHRQSGQAIVTLVDPTGRRKDVLLGRYGSSESRSEYARVIAEWEAGSRTFALSLQSLSDLTVNELLIRFWAHVEEGREIAAEFHVVVLQTRACARICWRWCVAGPTSRRCSRPCMPPPGIC